jgi:hypothetical protein
MTIVMIILLLLSAAALIKGINKARASYRLSKTRRELQNSSSKAKRDKSQKTYPGFTHPTYQSILGLKIQDTLAVWHNSYPEDFSGLGFTNSELRFKAAECKISYENITEPTTTADANFYLFITDIFQLSSNPHHTVPFFWFDTDPMHYYTDQCTSNLALLNKSKGADTHEKDYPESDSISLLETIITIPTDFHEKEKSTNPEKLNKYMAVLRHAIPVTVQEFQAHQAYVQELDAATSKPADLPTQSQKQPELI